MRRLSSSYEIGAYRFRGCRETMVTKSIHSYIDKATIDLPATSVLKSDDIELPSRQTAKQFEVGDKVKIELGYDGDTREEFRGFVSRVNFSQPVKIECEGYGWLLRYRCTLTESWRETTLREVLQAVADAVGADPETGKNHIDLHEAIPDIPMKNIQINNASGAQVIDYLKGLFNGVLTAFFVGQTLYMGLSYTDIARETVRYRLNWNTREPRSLKLRRAEDTQVKVEMKFRNDAGQQITTTTGADGGIVKRDNLTVVTDVTTVQKVAEAKLLQESYDGYEGSIDTLLIPYAEPGYRAELRDFQYGERAGNYFVEGVAVKFGTGGTNRRVSLGLKLSDQ